MNRVRRLLLLVSLLVMATGVSAQDSRWWVGIELGDPSGITLLKERPSGPDIEILAAWDLDNFLFLNGHLLFAGLKPLAEHVTWFYGPGVFIGVIDSDSKSEAGIGASGRIGIQYGRDRFAAYLQFTPRFEVIPATDFALGGGIGFRIRI